MRELVFSTVIAELKNAFAEEPTDPDLIELLYRGVAEPLKVSIGAVTKTTASKIVNRQPGGNPLKLIRAHSQDQNVKDSIAGFFKRMVICHFIPDMEEEVIFHFRSIIKEDKRNISDSKTNEMLQLAKKETFAEFLGTVYLYSLTRNNVLTPEAKERINAEVEAYKRHPLDDVEIPEKIIHEERAYTEALAAAFAEDAGKNSFSLEDIRRYPQYADELADQRQYYFAAEAVRRGTRDIYKEEDQFNILKDEMYEQVKEIYRKKADSGLDRLSNVLIRAADLKSDRCWLFRDTDWIGVPQKKGVCHFLVNDGKLKGWVREDDRQVVQFNIRELSENTITS